MLTRTSYRGIIMATPSVEPGLGGAGHADKPKVRPAWLGYLSIQHCSRCSRSAGSAAYKSVRELLGIDSFAYDAAVLGRLHQVPPPTSPLRPCGTAGVDSTREPERRPSASQADGRSRAF